MNRIFKLAFDRRRCMGMVTGEPSNTMGQASVEAERAARRGKPSLPACASGKISASRQTTLALFRVGPASSAFAGDICVSDVSVTWQRDTRGGSSGCHFQHASGRSDYVPASSQSSSAANRHVNRFSTGSRTTGSNVESSPTSTRISTAKNV